MDSSTSIYTGGLRQMPLRRDTVFKNIVKDLGLQAKEGSVVKIALLSCPDYSYKVDKSGWGIYTHKKLGYGPGMLTFAYSKAFKELTKTACGMGAKLKVYLFYGDIEAKDGEIREKINLTKEEYLNRLQCNISSGKAHLKSLVCKKCSKYIEINSVGMDKTIYTPEVIQKAKLKLHKINPKDISEVGSKRKDVIESLYGIKQSRDTKLFEKKVEEQIFDKLVVGTYFDQLINNGQKWYLLSIIPESLKIYIDFGNSNTIPLLKLGT